MLYPALLIATTSKIEYLRTCWEVREQKIKVDVLAMYEAIEGTEDMYKYPGSCLGVSSVTLAEPSYSNSAMLVLANIPSRSHTGLSSDLSDESSHVPMNSIPTRLKE